MDYELTHLAEIKSGDLILLDCFYLAGLVNVLNIKQNIRTSSFTLLLSYAKLLSGHVYTIIVSKDQSNVVRFNRSRLLDLKYLALREVPLSATIFYKHKLWSLTELTNNKEFNPPDYVWSITKSCDAPNTLSFLL
jgi:hypothetical protein